MSVSDLPVLNAGLNGLSALLLAAGYACIRSGRREAHRNCMIAALVSSTLFLTSYLVYHFHVGSVPFRGQGPIRTAYFTILLTHTILAVLIVPLVATTASRALRGRLRQQRIRQCTVTIRS